MISLMPSDRSIELLTVMQWRGFGPAKARALAGMRPQNFATAAVKRWPQYAAAVTDPSYRRGAEGIVSEASRIGIWMLSLVDEEYPSLLRDIEDAPPVIFGKGNMEMLRRTCVAVVGTREASPSGTAAARTTARALARRGVCVVSGLAHGIDTAAHEGALDGGGLTIAVLAHGLQMVYPAENRGLAARIIEAGGALLSEHPPGTTPHRPEFVRRNRIQSGLSVASVVVETGEEGGTMHQANFTLKQGRKLFAILPKSESESSLNTAGAKKLLREKKATAVCSTSELLRELSLSEGEPPTGEVSAPSSEAHAKPGAGA